LRPSRSFLPPPPFRLSAPPGPLSIRSRTHSAPPQPDNRPSDFVRDPEALGFSLDEVRELLEIGDGHCADVRTRAEEKRDRVVAQISELDALRRTLDTLIGACLAGRDDAHCPIVESLAKPERRSR